MSAIAEAVVPGVDVRRALDALFILMRDPNRLDQVLRLGEAINRPAFERLWRMFEEHPEGRAVLAERPRLDESHVDFEALASLPKSTLGREYADFLRTRGISPKPFEVAPNAPDERMSYLVLRIRQTHDVWHVLTGHETDVPGELYLQAFTYAQMRVPLSFVLVLTGSLRWGWRQPGYFKNLLASYRAGRRANAMAPTFWERHWGETVESLREQLKVVPFAPAV
jgi:ubiquinone biosynthesis protein COQ4